MLNRQNFEIAEICPTGEGVPPVIQGIQVRIDGTSATNGHAAIIVSSMDESQPSLFTTDDIEPADFFTPFILDRESALKIAKATPKKCEDGQAVFPVVDATTENQPRAMLSISDMFHQSIFRSQKIEGVFPDIEKVIPDLKTAKFSITLSSELLQSVLKVIGKFCKSHGTTSLTLSLYGAESPIRIDANGLGQKLTSVVMPMRGSEEPQG